MLDEAHKAVVNMAWDGIHAIFCIVKDEVKDFCNFEDVVICLLAIDVWVIFSRFFEERVNGVGVCSNVCCHCGGVERSRHVANPLLMHLPSWCEEEQLRF